MADFLLAVLSWLHDNGLILVLITVMSGVFLVLIYLAIRAEERVERWKRKWEEVFRNRKLRKAEGKARARKDTERKKALTREATVAEDKACGMGTYSKEMQMNKKQKRLLIVVASVIGLMLLFPPFYAFLPGGQTGNLGHSWIFAPPFWSYVGEFMDYPQQRLRETMPKGVGCFGRVDAATLLTQWIGVLIIGGIVFVLFKDSKGDPPR